MAGRFGSRLKELRIEKGLTLREFCARNHFDASNYSKIERGLFAPPSAEKIAEYAKALGVAVGSDVYVDLLDLAAVDRGELPSDLLSDEQVLDELPALFRTLRGQRLEPEQMEKLVQLLRRR